MKILLFLILAIVPAIAQELPLLSDADIAALVEQMAANEKKMQAELDTASTALTAEKAARADAVKEADFSKQAMQIVQQQADALALAKEMETQRANSATAKCDAVTKKYHHTLNFFGWVAAFAAGLLAFNFLTGLVIHYRLCAALVAAAAAYGAVWAFF